MSADDGLADRLTEVAIIGAGPAGLSAARVLSRAGVRDVMVIERAPEAGGLPRFCGHPGWGVRDLRRVMRGPDYARALALRAGVKIATGVSALRLRPGGILEVTTRDGPASIAASAVLLATGTRETPRGGRLVGGARPWGVITTGAFQEMVYAGGMVPFHRPVIVGTELVGFSALLTARHAGIRPVAMLEEGARPVARRPADLIAHRLLGVPMLTGARLMSILGKQRVEAVEIEAADGRRILACDGVIFSGRFVPESFLARASGIEIDPCTGGPAIDDAFRCSDPCVFAAGNVLRPVEYAGFAAAEGMAAARAILRALQGGLPSREAAARVRAGGALRYVTPQYLLRDGVGGRAGRVRLRARARVAHRGTLSLLADGVVVARRRVNVLPERRLSCPVPSEHLARARAFELVLD